MAQYLLLFPMKRFVKCFFELLTQALVSAVGNGAGKRAQNAPVDI